MCRVSFKQFPSFLRRCSGAGEGRRSRKSCESLRQVIPSTSCRRHQLSLGRGFPPLDTGVKARRLYTPHRRCRPVPAQWALPLDPSSALPPLHPATEGSPPSVLPHRRSWLPPQKRLPPVSPAPHPHIYAFRLEVDTEYACGDCRSKHQVQPRHFDRNLPDFRLFFLPPLPPESHAPLRRHWRRLSVPHCTAG